MTKSSTMQSADTPEPKARKRAPKGDGNFFLVTLFRLLLLAVSGSLAAAIGIAIAQIYPNPSQEPPIVETLLRQSQNLIAQAKRLPASVTGNPSDRSGTPSLSPIVPPTIAPTTQATPAPTTQITTVPNAAPNAAPTTAPNASPAAPTATASPSPTAPKPTLSSAERAKLQTELTQIRNQLQTLGDRTTTLESQLGTSQTAATLEDRIQAIEQQLTPGASPAPAPSPAAATGTNTAPTGSSAPAFSAITNPTAQPFNTQPMVSAPVAAVPIALKDNVLKVTLPSDALFAADRVTLRPETQAILTSIATDLQQYPNARIQVAAYVDQQGTVTGDRKHSFEQAKAIRQYLSTQLSDGHNLVALGYGNSRPLVENTTPENRQRNRRIEITIHPE
ncbi:MAG: OmpA family protein [Oculatellaceae cyanobacterium Prado106]|nr:OmpA family protein [Oculatellaceae cyanobacterium Prado106]